MANATEAVGHDNMTNVRLHLYFIHRT